jgi:lipopolysaccharide assembly outer membrane protein LptD (OstA)
MTNLRAPGVSLGEAAAPQSYSVMNIERAANVTAAHGRVGAMTGGVAISLESPRGAPLRLGASEVVFAWSEGESPKPTGIQMRGGVQVSGPQGDIRSERADVNLSAQQFEFTGSVRGALPDLESFTTDKLVFKPQSNDIVMTNFVAKGVPIAETEATDDAAPKSEFTQMDIQNAPVVTLKNGRPDRMEGGIELVLRSDSPDAQPLVLKAEQGSFTYGETDGRTPQRVVFTGNVDVAGPDLNIKCGEVDLDVGAGKLIFSENVAGSMEGVQGFTASRVTRDLQTGVTQTEGFTAKELDPNFTGPDQTAVR